MQQVTLGRTGLTVSAVGMGCGGHSRLGQTGGASFEDSVTVVQAAIDEGVTFIDTAVVYGTEEIVGQAIKGRRDEVVLSTKAQVIGRGQSPTGRDFISGSQLIESLEASLKRLRTDRVDVFHLHGVIDHQYAYCREELLPALQRLRVDGKVRFFGLTERFIHDPQHTMLELALADPEWDVVMVGFNMINQSAARTILPLTGRNDAGTLCMFAVRRILRDRPALSAAVANLIASGEVDGADVDPDDPLGFVVRDGAAASVVEAAYRFCRHKPGLQVVLTGTGNVDHLKQNIAALNAGPLPDGTIRQLERIFGRVSSFSGN